MVGNWVRIMRGGICERLGAMVGLRWLDIHYCGEDAGLELVGVCEVEIGLSLKLL